MLIPGLIGGDQYYVYRGNCSDQQTYVEETVALSMHPISWYEDQNEEEVSMVSDVLWRGYRWAVKDRPSAGLMIAVLRCNPEGEIYWVVYLYRMFMQAMIAASILYLLQSVTENETRWPCIRGISGLVIAALYCMGFWGQIQYDIDAVSQISSVTVLVALTAVFLQYAQKMVDGKICNYRQYLLMVLLASAGLALYLESALVHGALYLMAGVFLLMREKKKLNRNSVLQLAGIPILSLMILLMTNYRIVGFLMGQVRTSVSSRRQTWADYFNAWWLGKYGIDDGRITGPVSKLANFIVSSSGMYNMTVNYSRYHGVVALVLTGLVVLLALLVIFCLASPFIKKSEGVSWSLWCIILTGILIILGMCVNGKTWSAGKLLYYISPYLYIFLCMPVLKIENCHGLVNKIVLFLAVVMLLSNTKMVLERCYNIKVNGSGSGYRGNYPSDMIPGLKITTNFAFDTQQLEGVDGVMIRDLSMVSDYQFYLQYLKVKLTCAEIPFVPENDVDYYQNTVEISEKRRLKGNLASIEIVKGEDDRYGIEIVTQP